jgi:hypothetical protein
MRNSHITRKMRRLIIFCVGLCALMALPFLSKAQPSTSVNIVNNSSRMIRNVYLSHVDADDWTANQLGDSTISAGQSFNLSISVCDQQQIKVIAEDVDGCFLSTVVSCGGNSTWTVTNDTDRNCGN